MCSIRSNGIASCFSISIRKIPSACRRSANGSFSPVGFSPTPNNPTRVSSLSASATHSAVVAFRQSVAGKARVIVLANRHRHGGWLTVVLRVILAHHALQLGELTDHQRAQVGLGKPGGTLGQDGLDAQLLRNTHRNRGDPFDTLQLRAELAVINNVRQSGHAALERLLAILIVEKLGIGQPRAHDARVAGANRSAAIGRLDIRHQQEAIGELARAIVQREILLVLLHRQQQALGRHRQVIPRRTSSRTRPATRPAP